MVAGRPINTNFTWNLPQGPPPKAGPSPPWMFMFEASCYLHNTGKCTSKPWKTSKNVLKTFRVDLLVCNLLLIGWAFVPYSQLKALANIVTSAFATEALLLRSLPTWLRAVEVEDSKSTTESQWVVCVCARQSIAKVWVQTSPRPRYWILITPQRTPKKGGWGAKNAGGGSLMRSAHGKQFLTSLTSVRPPPFHFSY